ncbi:MAG: hypothetical protein JXA64_01800 [Candidatus Fermentibacteraceae bacterium]|nr:hypothetical protein [Candidatus Fermentibacteraceae bacterium]MBN2607820.1 hypothetical protein [Candidatus Fermentibacteraceae bacterium]
MGPASASLNALFDALLYPLGGLPAFWGLLLVSLLSGIGMIAVFKAVSDQERIADLRRRMGGEILGILLHVSSPGTVLRFAGRLIRSNTVYLSCLLKPLLVMALPFMLVWGQLEARYGAEGMEEQVPVTVTVQFRDELPAREDMLVQLTGAGLVPPLVMVQALDQVSFRVVAESRADAELLVNGTAAGIGRTGEWNGSRVLRGFDAAPSLWRLFTPHVQVVRRVSGGPDSGWYSLEGRDYSIFGWHWSWTAVFLVFSMLSALAGARFLRVRI